MVKRLTKHFRDLAYFDEDHERRVREMTAAALFESHHDHKHAKDTMADILNRDE